MLHGAGMPEAMGWRRAVEHHTFLWNRTHIGARTGKTPYEAMSGREPSIVNVGVFGCDAFVHQDRSQRDTTFSAKAEPGVYLGHCIEQNCAIVHMLGTGKTLKVKDVTFKEGSFDHVKADATGHSHDVPVVALDSLQANDTDEDDAQSKSGLDEEDDASEEDDQQYPVQSILASRTYNGRKEYQVKWSRYKHPTWEPADVMQSDAPSDVEKFESRAAQKSTHRPATRSTTMELRSSSSSAASNHAAQGDTGSDAEDDNAASLLAVRSAAASCL